MQKINYDNLTADDFSKMTKEQRVNLRQNNRKLYQALFQTVWKTTNTKEKTRIEARKQHLDKFLNDMEFHNKCLEDESNHYNKLLEIKKSMNDNVESKILIDELNKERAKQIHYLMNVGDVLYVPSVPTIEGMKYCMDCNQYLDTINFSESCSKCKSCTSKYTEKLHKKYPLNMMLSAAKERAKTFKFDFNLTLDYLESIRVDFCPYLEVELIYGGGKGSMNVASLDRIDNTKGYIIGNVRIISKKANMMKHSASILELIIFAKNIETYIVTNWHDQQFECHIKNTEIRKRRKRYSRQQRKLNDNEKWCPECNCTHPIKYFQSDKGNGTTIAAYCRKTLRNTLNKNKEKDPIKYKISRQKIRAKTRDLEFNITEEDLPYRKLCPILGKELDYNAFKNPNKRSPNWATIDRKDNSKGYVRGNVDVICDMANIMKGSASSEELLIFAKNIIRLHT